MRIQISVENFVYSALACLNGHCYYIHTILYRIYVYSGSGDRRPNPTLYKLKPITIRRLNRYAYRFMGFNVVRNSSPRPYGWRVAATAGVARAVVGSGGRSCRQHVSDRMTHALSAGY